MNIAEIADRFTRLSGDRSSRFEEMAGAVFAYQRAANPVYNRYCKEILPSSEPNPDGVSPRFVPYLPIDAFKHGSVTTFDADDAEAIFLSSATGRSGRSRHYVRDLGVYERAVSAGFERWFGPGPWRIVGHLPEYASDSSLVYMVRHLIRNYGAEGSRFTVQNGQEQDPAGDVAVLDAAVEASRRDGIRLMVFGAAFGLLDLVSSRAFALPPAAVVVETGGMKTHRRQITRTELHARLSEGFGVPRDHVRSEYGMCELMSQSYTDGRETFTPPPWTRCYVVDPADPTRELPLGRPGILAILDLANLYSCSFLLTADRAVLRADGFEIIGRLSNAELRGCNYLLEDA